MTRALILHIHKVSYYDYKVFNDSFINTPTFRQILQIVFWNTVLHIFYEIFEKDQLRKIFRLLPVIGSISLNYMMGRQSFQFWL